MPGPELDKLYTRILLESGALLFGRFRLASGVESPIYIDLRRVLAKPRYLRAIVDGLSVLLEHLGYTAHPIVGVATGGIPWAAALAYHLGVPTGYVRPRAKDHGTGKIVEGVEPGEVVLLDDVATTGESLAAAAEALLNEGYTVRAAVVVVDREQGAASRLANLGLQLHSLVTLREILDSAAAMGLLAVERVEEIKRQLGLA
ncbi:MAG: orotate phosphoribosyltransferase [Crenarchaeota archaeon]|nr:orotate phosphoribosyltransferase [Thermoproteota archaeon]